MVSKISRTEAEKKIRGFFKDIKNKTPSEIKKTKKIAMSHNLPLRELRKKFCRKCFNSFSGKEKIRIKKRVKNITCQKCDYTNRWKIR